MEYPISVALALKRLDTPGTGHAYFSDQYDIHSKLCCDRNPSTIIISMHCFAL